MSERDLSEADPPHRNTNMKTGKKAARTQQHPRL